MYVYIYIYIYTKHTKYIKYELCRLDIYKYIYIYIYIKKTVIVRMFWIFEMYFGVVGVFCTINCHFKFGIRIRCLFLYIVTYFTDVFEIVLDFLKMP